MRKYDNLKKRNIEKKDENSNFDIFKNESNQNTFKQSDGFSIGIKTNKDLNLKKKRKEQIVARNHEINNVFSIKNITTYSKPFYETNEDYKSQNNQRSLTEDSIYKKIKKKREESSSLYKLRNKKKYENAQKRYHLFLFLKM